MLTFREREALLFITTEIRRTGGVAPSYQEIASHLGIRSRSTAGKFVKALAEKGYLRVLGNRARAMEVLRPPIERWFVWDDESQMLLLASCNRRNVA